MESTFKTDLYFHGEKIQEITHHTHLGLTFSSDITWKIYLNNIKEKTSKRIDILRSLKWKLDRKTLEIMYFSFIRPLFEYADIVFDTSAPQHQYIFQC